MDREAIENAIVLARRVGDTYLEERLKAMSSNILAKTTVVSGGLGRGLVQVSMPESSIGKTVIVVEEYA